jgi:hypothetical protein
MELRSKIYTKAIIIGLAAGVVLGILVGPLEILLLFGPSLSGTPLHIATLCSGSLASLFAAYVTAHNSTTNKLANVLVLWGIYELLGLVSVLVVALPVWYNIVGASALFAMSIFGWYLKRSLSL